MYTSGVVNRSSVTAATTASHAFTPVNSTPAALISEVLYREDQPMMAQLLLLPLLQQLGQQSRWQLWLTPQQKLSRQWVQASGLPLTKVMQLRQMSPCDMLDSMVRASRTGNYSVVIGWLSEELSVEEHARLQSAAEEGNAMVFIMRPVQTALHPTGQFNGLKIHSNLYH
ncbi:TPA: cell division inhibitor SulA [Kluyvera georgiana]|uniref:Cell division inhibitor SulA n=1 Tax=Kluyvera georgiana ATCC 51603 TaxID=1354264 RepID=A0A1B7JDE5_9ENTR|nr:SOS-induced cell division inhibitor SulA [Kluyvera georgiana]MDA8492471.1 cell division inhibitor SulA [Kluyvera georgiana]OAT45980.1 cell division inhibitor [Kluyvera georgiana ATCC 51603]HED1420203.1 cell division inhibitor SulA [Kluyvera georgiana]